MRVTIVGAGAIGCWVGGMLAASCDVTLVGRSGVLDPIAASGLTVTTLDGASRTLPGERLTLTGDLASGADADIVLVTVKSKDTETVAAELAAQLPAGIPVVSLQNGLHNANRLREHLAPVAAGVVEFNVVSTAAATYRQATSGGLLVEATADLDDWIAAARKAGLTVSARDDLPAVQRAKLLLNLNNAINALSGVPLREQLLNRDLRWVLSACQREALAVFGASGDPVATLGPIGPAAIASLLRAPTPLFRALARANLRVDPSARSSMADDFAAGRPTEIGELQGEVVRLAKSHGIPTPVCSAVCQLVAEAEAAGPSARRTWTGPELRRAVSR